MRYHIISIFPEIFDSFVSTSLLAKAREKSLIAFSFTNPRDFCTDKQRQVDDQIYGGGAGLLMKAPPIIAAIQSILSELEEHRQVAVVFPSPSPISFDQSTAHQLTEKYTDLIFICGRYEGIDHRVELWCQEQFGVNFYKLSLGKFVTL
jgi:tRNA (guanine37-N1)-methyltransferase